VVVVGYEYGKNFYDRLERSDIAQGVYNDLFFKQQKQELGFVVVAAGLTFFISLALIAGLYSNLSPKVLLTLAAANLILEFAIAVVIALVASQNSNYKHAFEDTLKGNQKITQIPIGTYKISWD
jgi:hypothetical protein